MPDFYLVLPWHFKKEILNREKNLIKKGSRFIFSFAKIKNLLIKSLLFENKVFKKHFKMILKIEIVSFVSIWVD